MLSLNLAFDLTNTIDTHCEVLAMQAFHSTMLHMYCYHYCMFPCGSSIRASVYHMYNLVKDVANDSLMYGSQLQKW